MAISIQLSTLIIDSSSYGGGGTSSVHLCRTPGGVGKKLLKLYTPEIREELDAPALRSIIRMPLLLPDHQQSVLQEQACWPDQVVLDGRDAVGVLMPLASAQYFEEPDLSKPRHMTRMGRPPGDGPSYYQLPQKIARMGKLVSLMQLLHQCGVVIGDVNPKNVLVGAPEITPQVCLIDCDSVVLRGISAFQPRQPPDWTIPGEDGGNDFSIATDYGKLALLALRTIYEDYSLTRFDLGALEMVLKRREIELLDRAARGRFAHQDKIAWGSLAGAWEKFDRGRAQLYYRNDEFEFQSWSSAVWPVRQPAVEGPFRIEAPPPARPTAVVSADLKRRAAVKAATRARQRAEASAKAKAGATAGAKAEVASASTERAELAAGFAVMAVGLVSVLATVIVLVLGIVMLASGDVTVFFGAEHVVAADRSGGAVTLAVVIGLLAVLGVGVVGLLVDWPKQVVLPLLAGVAVASALIFFGPPQQHVSALAGKVPGLGSIVPHGGK